MKYNRTVYNAIMQTYLLLLACTVHFHICSLKLDAEFVKIV